MPIVVPVTAPNGATLHCDVLVLCVPCPCCKVKAGSPCKSRTPSRPYMQSTHFPRRALWQIYKRGRFETPARAYYENLRRRWGIFDWSFCRPDDSQVIEGAVEGMRKQLAAFGIADDKGPAAG